SPRAQSPASRFPEASISPPPSPCGEGECRGMCHPPSRHPHGALPPSLPPWNGEGDDEHHPHRGGKKPASTAFRCESFSVFTEESLKLAKTARCASPYLPASPAPRNQHQGRYLTMIALRSITAAA